MSNPIKYTTGTETLALKKGNFYIGTGDVGKGPSDTTGFYQGDSPSEGGYVIYMNKDGAPGNLSYHNAPTDNDLIAFTNNLTGQSYTTVNECLVYFASQTDKVVLNRNYESIVTDGLVLNLDAGFTPSYPKNGTSWYDVSPSGNNGTLTNSPTFNSNDGGSIVFDGVDDKVLGGSNTNLNFGTENFSIIAWIKTTRTNDYQSILTLDDNASGNGLDYYTQINSGKLRTWVGGTVQVGNIPICTGNWVFTCISRVSGTVNQYINGVFDRSQTQNGNMLSNQSVKIGIAHSSSYPFLGNVGIIQIYNRALSATEVLQNYNAQKGRFGL